jgi:leucyl-tRNA synthetase
VCTDQFDKLELNKVLIELMDFYSKLEKNPSKLALTAFIKMVYPFAPHIAEEVWEKLGNRTMLAKSSWPELDKSKVNKKAEQNEDAIRKTVSDIKQILKITGKRAKQIYIYVIPPELKNYMTSSDELSSELNANVQVFASNDANKIDPESKAKKAKLGKPGIYLE